MSLWHDNWKHIHLQDKAYWMIAFVDDSSRLITSSGLYENATAANTIDTLKKRFEEYDIPDAI